MRKLCHKLTKLSIAGILFASVIALAQPRTMRLPGPIVDPENDPVNVDVVTNSVSALVMRLEIRGDDATPTNLLVARVPVSMVDFSEDPSLIVIEALDRNGVLVGRTSVSDRKMYARDGEPVIATNRVIPVVVPLLSRPDEVRIALPGLVAQPPTSVKQTFDAYCTDFPTDEICSGAPPDDSPFFNLLRPPT